MNTSVLRAIERGFRIAINSMIDVLNDAIRAYNKLPTSDISSIPRIGTQTGGTGGTVGRIPLRAAGGSSPPNSPHLVMVGDQKRYWEHTLREDQIVRLMGRALQTQQPRTTEQHLHFHQPVQSYTETRRAVREVMEEMAWG